MQFYNYKRSMCKAARELGYERVMPDVRQRIFACKDEVEISNIMSTCRHLMR